MSRCRMIEFWSNEAETEFGIKVAGEQEFRAITCGHLNMIFERVIDSSALKGKERDWVEALDRWVSERYNRKVHSSATALVAAKTHTSRLLLN